MMRLGGCIAFFLLARFSLAQKTGEADIKIKLEDLKTKKNIHGLISPLPDNCQVILYDVTAKVDGRIKRASCSTGEDLSIIQQWAAVTSDLHIDITKYSCNKSIQKQYHLIIVK